MKRTPLKWMLRASLPLALIVAAMASLRPAGAQLPPPTPTVSLKDSSRDTNEKVGVVVFEVTLSASSKDTVTVQYATEDGTASAGSDYTAASGTLTFAPGVTSQSFYVEITDDGTGEQSEYFHVKLSNPQNATVGNDSCVVNIEDGAGSGPAWVAFEYSSWTCSESDGTVTITVLMTGSPTEDVSVDYITYEGSATTGSDYSTSSGTLTWKKGDAGKTKSFTITILDDSLVEGSETVFLVLSNPQNAALVAPYLAVLNISDDDVDCD